MKAVAEYVWVKPIFEGLQDSGETLTDSGLILMKHDVEKPTKGVVTAIGALCDKIMLKGLKVGDTVMFDPNHIRTIDNPETGEENFIFFDRNVIAIV